MHAPEKRSACRRTRSRRQGRARGQRPKPFAVCRLGVVVCNRALSGRESRQERLITGRCDQAPHACKAAQPSRNGNHQRHYHGIHPDQPVGNHREQGLRKPIQVYRSDRGKDQIGRLSAFSALCCGAGQSGSAQARGCSSCPALACKHAGLMQGVGNLGRATSR